MNHEFTPKETSTPKVIGNVSGPEIVAEGEKRSVIRDKEERNEKAMSVYENVDQNETCDTSHNPENSTVWYEYGCV